MRHRYGLLYSLFWVTFPRSHVIDRSKVADVVVVISTRICFVEREESLGFFFVLGCFWESKKPQKQESREDKNPQYVEHKSLQKTQDNIYRDAKLLISLFFCFFLFLYKLSFVWVIPSSKCLLFAKICYFSQR